MHQDILHKPVSLVTRGLHSCMAPSAGVKHWRLLNPGGACRFVTVPTSPCRLTPALFDSAQWVFLDLRFQTRSQ